MNEAERQQYEAGAGALIHTETQEALEIAKMPPHLRARHYSDRAYPPFHDPRGESRWMKEAGREEPAEFVQVEAEPVEMYDDHVKRHYRIVGRRQELRDLIELCWIFRTGKIQSVLKSGKVGGALGVDRAAIAAEYLEGTKGFGELLWPIVVAVAEHRFKREQWGTIRPAFSAARALWNGFIPNLVDRLTREPFDSYYARRERELLTLPEPDHLEIADSVNLWAA